MEATYEYLEPLKYYELSLKEQHQINIKDYFENLTSKSDVDVFANKDTCNKYYKEYEALKKLKSKLGATKAGAVIMIILAIVAFTVGLILLIAGINSAAPIAPIV